MGGEGVTHCVTVPSQWFVFTKASSIIIWKPVQLKQLPLEVENMCILFELFLPLKQKVKLFF